MDNDINLSPPENNMLPDPLLDEHDWVPVPGPPSVLCLDDDDGDDDEGNDNNGIPNNAPRPKNLSRAIGEGKLRDSFDIATCPRLGHTKAGTDLDILQRAAEEFMQTAWYKRNEAAILARRRKKPVSSPPPISTPWDDPPSLMPPPGSMPPLRSKPHRPKSIPMFGEMNKRDREARNRRARGEGPTPDPYIVCPMALPRTYDMPGEMDLRDLRQPSGMLEAKGGGGSGTTAKEEEPAARRRCFSMSAIKDCIMARLGRDKSAAKGTGEKTSPEQPQQTGGVFEEEKQLEKIVALLDEDKDKIVVSVEPSSKSSRKDKDEDPRTQPWTWKQRDPTWLYRNSLPVGPIFFTDGKPPWEKNTGQFRPGRTQPPQDGGIFEKERPREGNFALGEDKDKVVVPPVSSPSLFDRKPCRADPRFQLSPPRQPWNSSGRVRPGRRRSDWL